MPLGRIIKTTSEIAFAKIFKRRIPFQVKQNITYRCNLSCPFCLLNKELNKPHQFEMDTLQIKSMMAEFKTMGTRFWLFSGGESLLRDDLGELILYAKNKMNFHCSVATNGVLLAERLKNDSSFKRLDIVQISLDGPEQIHDNLRGHGTYKKIILALDILRKLPIKIVFAVLISKVNLNYFGDLIKLATQYNANIAFQIIDTKPAATAGLKNKFFPEKEAFKKVIGVLIEEKKRNHNIISSLPYLKMIRDFWPDKTHKIRCFAGKFYCEINPEGLVLPCCAKSNLTDTANNGLNVGVKKAFLGLNNMSGCRSCYYAGPQEINILTNMPALCIAKRYEKHFYKQ